MTRNGTRRKRPWCSLFQWNIFFAMEQCSSQMSAFDSTKRPSLYARLRFWRVRDCAGVARHGSIEKSLLLFTSFLFLLRFFCSHGCINSCTAKLTFCAITIIIYRRSVWYWSLVIFSITIRNFKFIVEMAKKGRLTSLELNPRPFIIVLSSNRAIFF